MKSNLKRIYESRDNFDIIKSPRYHLMPNPIYQVNEFITNIDKGLNRNFLENLKDLKIEKESLRSIASDYDCQTNTLYCKNNKADVFGLLNVASNNRSKPNTGIILEDGVGYALNKGLTELFTYNINNKKCVFPLEATIAKALLIVESEVATYSYFKNSGEILNLKNRLIKDFMISLDTYHENYIKLIGLYDERWTNEFKKLKTNEQIKQLEKIREEIHELEQVNFSVVNNILISLIEIIEKSFIEESEKESLAFKLNHEFNLLFDSEKFCYLVRLSEPFDEYIYKKRRIRWKR